MSLKILGVILWLWKCSRFTQDGCVAESCLYRNISVEAKCLKLTSLWLGIGPFWIASFDIFLLYGAQMWQIWASQRCNPPEKYHSPTLALQVKVETKTNLSSHNQKSPKCVDADQQIDSRRMPHRFYLWHRSWGTMRMYATQNFACNDFFTGLEFTKMNSRKWKLFWSTESDVRSDLTQQSSLLHFVVDRRTSMSSYVHFPNSLISGWLSRAILGLNTSLLSLTLLR